MKKTLCVRADANPHIGSGHVMRCLSIARAARRQGARCVMICADENSLPLLNASGFRHVCLNSDWDTPEDELAALAEVLLREKAAGLLVDKYNVTEDYLRELKQRTRLFYLDDLCAFTHPCDVLVNYNCYAEDMGYPAAYAGKNTSLLLGTQYVPLREEFQNLPVQATREATQDVLITTGGADPYGMAERVAVYLLKKPAPRRIHIVVGAYSAAMEHLQALQSQHSGRVRLYSRVRQMAQLMRRCDVAVSAGGSTLYELCACGIPTVVFSMADNQLPGARRMGGLGMVYAGDARDGGGVCAAAIAEAVWQLAANAETRAQQSAVLRNMADGGGAQRLARALLSPECVKYSQPTIKARREVV